MGDNATYLEAYHTIGCNVNFPDNSHLHPNGVNFIMAAGASIVIGNLNDPHEQLILSGHDDLITCVAVSHDGRFIASGQKGKNADVIVWSFDEKSEIYRFSEHDHGIACLAFSDDDRYLATCGDANDQKMFVWDIGTGRIITWVTVNPNPTTCITWGGFVKDVKFRDTNIYQLATAGPRGFTLWTLDVIAGQALGKSMQQYSATLQSRQYQSIAISSDGRWAFGGSTTGDVVAVSLKTHCMQGISKICSKGVTSILIAPDNSTLYIAGGDGTLTEAVGIFQAEDGDESMRLAQLTSRRVVTLDGSISCLGASHDWSMLIAATQCGSVVCIRLADMASRVIRHSPNHSLSDVTFLHGISDSFLTTDLGGYLSYWDLESLSLKFKVKTTSSLTAKPLSISASEDFAIVGHDSGLVRGFDLSDGSDLWQVDCSEGGSVNSIELSKNQRFFVTGNAKGAVKVWTTRLKECQHTLKQHTAEVHQVKLSEDNLTAFSVGRDRALYSWDLTEGRRATGHFVRTGAINSVSLTHDKNIVATTCQTGDLHYWDLRSMRPAFEIPLGEEHLTSSSHVGAGGSLDTNLVVVGGASTLKAFDLKKGNQVAEVSKVNSTGVIRKVCFAPDGKQLVSVGDDQTICVVNVFSG